MNKLCENPGAGTYRDIIEHSLQGIIIFSPHKVLFHNPAFETYVDLTAAELCQTSTERLFDFVHEDDRAIARDRFRRRLAGEAVEPRYEMRLRNKNGDIRWMEIFSNLTEFRGEKAVLSVFLDVTYRKLANQRIHKLNECLLGFTSDPRVNIDQLTELCGEQLGADVATYSRQVGSVLHSISLWGAPPEWPQARNIHQAICRELFSGNTDSRITIENFSESSQAAREPQIQTYGHCLYTAMPVKRDGKNVGVLSLFYKRPSSLSEHDTRFMGILASAIAQQEEQLQAREAQQESEERFRALVQASFDGIFIQQDGCIVEANQTVAEMYGASLEKLYELPMSEFVAPSSRELVRQHVRENYNRIYEAYGRRLDGSEFPLEVIGQYCRYQGRPARITAVRDIAERKATEGRLKSRLRFSEALNKLAESVVKIRDPQQLLNDATSYVASALDVDQALIYDVSTLDWEARMLSEWRSPDLDDFPLLERSYSLDTFPEIAHYLQSQREWLQSHDDAVHPALLKEGAATQIHQHLRIRSLFGYPFAFREDGYYVLVLNQMTHRRNWQEDSIDFMATVARLVGIAIMKIDYINDQKIMQQQIAQMQKMEAIGSLASGIAHDFNNILAAILGFTELSIISVPADSKVHENLQQILKAGNRAKDVVRQILSLSKRSTVEKMPMALKDIVEEASRLLRASFPTTIDIDLQTDGGRCIILADAAQLHQVIMNLSTNAFQAMPDNKGKLTLGIRAFVSDGQTADIGAPLPAGDYVCLCVADTGPGISPSIVDHIFQPFFTTKPPEEGTGLGLSMVKDIMASHNGHIRLQSGTEGSAFHLYFPQHKFAARQASVPPVTRQHRGSERILLVDDEANLVNIGKEMLEHLGYSVTTEIDSHRAFERFQQSPDTFDLVITDHTMPGLTGIELARELVRIRADVPIILMSGLGDMLAEDHIVNAGIAEYITKPVLSTRLSEVVRRVLGGPQQGRGHNGD